MSHKKRMNLPHAPAATRPVAQMRRVPAPALIAVCLFAAAAFPRLWGLADFFTTDEAYHWIERVERFSAALAAGDWAATNLTGHPGVTLMWLGSLGLALEHWALALGWVAPPAPIEHLAWLRVPSALLEALAVPLAWLLLRRLLAPTTALLAATLWALSPYLIAHGRLLHLDALLTTFVTLSLLCLLQIADCRLQIASDINRPSSIVYRQLMWLAFSGLFAGLALLTKGPALILLPVTGMLLLGLQSAERRAQIDTSAEPRTKNQEPAYSVIGSHEHRLSSIVYRLAMSYALWLGVALLVVLALWPALWIDPAGALQNYTGEIFFNGGRPNGDGQFFFGRAVADPGPLFYPVANVFRMTPGMLLGLVCYFGFTIYDLRKLRTKNQACPERSRREPRTNNQKPSIVYRPSSIVYMSLMFFILFWTLVMTLGPKKFDRYVLPTWPALLILAAAGWAALLRVLPGHGGRWVATLLLVGVLLGDALGLARVQPYYLSYYNPLLGGGAAAQRVLLIGWGEGMDQVGATLRSRPDAQEGQMLSALGATLQPFVPVPVQDVTKLGTTPANYAVVYLESLQRGANPAIYEQMQQTVPVATIVINGIQYATIHQLPKPFAQPIDAQFGAALRLRGVSVARGPNQLIVTPAWDMRATPPAEYHLFLHLLDAAGQRVAQVDVAPGGGDAAPTNQWQPGQQLAVPIGLGLPADLPPGAYRLVLGLYDVTNGQRVPFSGGVAADPAQAGPDALLLDEVTLP